MYMVDINNEKTIAIARIILRTSLVDILIGIPLLLLIFRIGLGISNLPEFIGYIIAVIVGVIIFWNFWNIRLIKNLTKGLNPLKKILRVNSLSCLPGEAACIWERIIRNDASKLGDIVNDIKTSKHIIVYRDGDGYEARVLCHDKNNKKYWSYLSWSLSSSTTTLEYGNYLDMIRYDYSDIELRSPELVKLLNHIGLVVRSEGPLFSE